MTISERLQGSESISAYKDSFKSPETVVYSCGRQVADEYEVKNIASTDYAKMLGIQNSIPPVPERGSGR